MYLKKTKASKGGPSAIAELLVTLSATRNKKYRAKQVKQTLLVTALRVACAC